MSKVFVNGTFDMLHPGHLLLLARAQQLGQQVIVAIDSDQRVRSIKGPGRPFYSQQERALMLMGLRYVDQVLIFDTDEELELIIKELEPDVMVKGSDWRGKTVIGQEYCKHIEWFDRIPRYSTTKIYENLSDR